MTTAGRTQRRRLERKRTDPSVVRVRLEDPDGNTRWATAYLSDINEGGVGLSLMTPLKVGAVVLLRGSFGEGQSEVQIEADVRWCTERTGGVFQVGLELATARAARARSERQEAISEVVSEDPAELDCYEIMQLHPKADADTIHRVHRILAERYHPDAPDTGNPEMFMRIAVAARILCDPEKRAKYDARYHAAQKLQWKTFDQSHATTGAQAEISKRKSILGLLYAKTVDNPERASMTAFEIEEVLGCPREHLQAALWYLKGKGFIAGGNSSPYSITIEGFDEVESHSRPEVKPQEDLEPVARGS